MAGGSGDVSGSRRLLGLLMLLVLPVAIGLGAALVLSLLREDERVSRDARVPLSRLHENVLFLEHVTGHVRQMTRLTPDLGDKLAKLRPQAVEEIDAINRVLPGSVTAERITAAWHVYERSLDRRLAGVRRGEAPRVLPAAQTHEPEPSYERLVDVLHAESETLGVRADVVSDRADFAAVLIVVAVALILAFLFHRHERVRRRSALAAVEQVALRESEQRFRALVENANDVVTVVDRDCVILSESGSVERVLGVQPERRVGTAFDAPLLEEDRVELRRLLASAAERPGTVATTEFQAQTANGETREFEATLRNLCDVPRIGGVVITHRDISERRALEEQLRQAQKMDAIGQLAGGVAHDFNNLLMVISGYAEQAEENLAGNSDRARCDLAEIRKAALRAGELTRQLLAFGRRQMLRPRLVSVNDAVSSAETLLTRLIGSHIKIVTELDADVVAVKADPQQLEQVIVNLAVNARDAMPSGGELCLRTSTIELDSTSAHAADLAPGRYASLEVTDTGSGMDAETLERAFEPFFTTKPLGKGTGLGLSTVHGIVRQSGGSVVIDSKPAAGTSIRVLLPQAEQAFDACATEEAVLPGAASVLVVEDEPAVCDLVRGLLENEGYDVAFAHRPQQALELARNRRFDLLVTDIVMPDMNGRELAQALRLQQPDLDVLFMSGYAGAAVLEQGLLEPGNPFLQKPFRLSELARAVKELLDGRAASPTAA